MRCIRMGRRRRKVVHMPKKKLPTVFLCPKCGKQSIDVEISSDRKNARVRCGNCELIEELVLNGGGYGLADGCAAGDTAAALILEVSVD